MPPDHGLADKKSLGVKGSKTQLTYAFTANADGSEKLAPLVIGKAHKPRAFQNKTGRQLGFNYQNNAKAWMTAVIYQEWLQDWDHELGSKNRKVLLLQDNFSGHIIPDGLQNIHIENFRPNLTSHVQPMDQGIIWCFKAHYRATYIERAIDCYELGTTPSDIYDIDQLQAMRLADAAWCRVDVTTIQNCWAKAGILPSMDLDVAQPNPLIPISSLLSSDADGRDPIIQAEQEVEHMLDELQSAGILQHCNRMGLQELLNPADEAWLMDETTDDEIFQAVMAVQEAQDEARPVAGGGDSDDNVDHPPTRQEVLAAVAIVNNYIVALDDPVAHKLEANLGLFRRQLRSEQSCAMVPTCITDFFPHI